MWKPTSFVKWASEPQVMISPPHSLYNFSISIPGNASLQALLKPEVLISIPFPLYTMLLKISLNISSFFLISQRPHLLKAYLLIKSIWAMTSIFFDLLKRRISSK